jgi:anti-sigma B factor antagonist
MAFNIKISDRLARLMLSGDIDLQVSGDIKAEIEGLSDIDRLEIDASDVTYIDSSGVAVLILARQFCAQHNMTLALPSISEAVNRVLQIARLDVVLPVGEVVNAPEPEPFSFDGDGDAFGAGVPGDAGFDSDDDLVNSLLSQEGMEPGETASGTETQTDSDPGGDFDGLDISAVDFSEPPATSSADVADEDAAPLSDSDDLKPGTFS